MESVEYHQLDRWYFECPGCGDFNELDDDPAYQESIECENCREEYKPIQG